MGVGAAAAPKRGQIWRGGVQTPKRGQTWRGGVQTHLLMPRRAAAANRLAVMAMTREERTLHEAEWRTAPDGELMKKCDEIFALRQKPSNGGVHT